MPDEFHDLIHFVHSGRRMFVVITIYFTLQRVCLMATKLCSVQIADGTGGVIRKGVDRYLVAVA